jgi:hypothetical protein
MDLKRETFNIDQETPLRLSNSRPRLTPSDAAGAGA